jgi:hypothetical protein
MPLSRYLGVESCWNGDEQQLLLRWLAPRIDLATTCQALTMMSGKPFLAFGLRHLERFGGWSLHVAHFCRLLLDTTSDS